MVVVIKIYNIERELVSTTSRYNSMEIQREINQIDKLKFYTDKETGGKIKLEGYIETNEGVFVVKENALSVNYSILAHMDLEEFDEMILELRLERMTLNEMVSKLTEGTGWTIIGDSDESKTITIDGLSIIDAIFRCVNLFSYEIRFNNIKKEVTIGETIGEDRGIYFHSDLNLRSLNMSSDTYDYATRLIPKGKEGLGIESVNDGVPYVENYTFSNKVITKIWRDERYTIVENLKEEAEAKLAEIAKPMSYLECSVADLSSHSDYDFLSYDVGDYIFLIDRELDVKDKYRIGSIRLFPKSIEDSLVVIENRQRSVNNIIKSQDEKVENHSDNLVNYDDRLSNIEDFLGLNDGGWDDGGWGDDWDGDGGWGDDCEDDTTYYSPTQLVEIKPSLKGGLVSWVDISDGDSVEYNSRGKVSNVRDFFTGEVVYKQDEIDKRPTLMNMDCRRWLSFNPDPIALQRWDSNKEVPYDLITQDGQYLENLKSKEPAVTILIAYHDRTPEVEVSGSHIFREYKSGYSSPLGYPYSSFGAMTSDAIFYEQYLNSDGFTLKHKRARNKNIISAINNVSYEDFQTFNSLGMNKLSYDQLRLQNSSDGKSSWTYNVNAFFTGEIAEVIVYHRELGSSELETLLEYLKNKYNTYTDRNLLETYKRI